MGCCSKILPASSVSKKSVTFLHAINATFFVKLTLHEKSRCARQKVRTGHF